MKNFNTGLTDLQNPLALNIEIEGQSYLYFSGTAYLGIPQNEQFLSLYIDGLKKYGLNNGTSRGNNVQLGIYNAAEQYAANHFGAEAALITSSGYLAAQLVIKSFLNCGKMLYAPQTHPALWLREPPVVSQKSFTEWAQETVSEINSSSQKKWVLVSNSLNNLFPELYDFSFLKEIHPENEIVLIADDSHGIGVLDQGRGIVNQIPVLKHVKVLVVASMAKALGVDAGIVLGGQELIQQLKKSNEFLGASPPSAAGLYAFMHAKAIYFEELERLKSNMTYFSSRIDKHDWDFVDNYPVYFYKGQNLYERLLKSKILISSFPYPDHNGVPLNRVVLSSWVNSESMDLLLETIASEKVYP